MASNQDLLDLVDQNIPTTTPDESQIIDATRINATFKAIINEMAARLPAGGSAGQVLAKATDADYETEWADGGTGGGGTGTNAYWVANDDGHIPTEAEFFAGTAIPITPGQATISFDLTAQTTDRWVFLAEPIGEPTKTFKYASPLDQENLGPDGQFNTGVALTTLRYYPSNAQTSNTSFPIQLKTTP